MTSNSHNATNLVITAHPRRQVDDVPASAPTERLSVNTKPESENETTSGLPPHIRVETVRPATPEDLGDTNSICPCALLSWESDGSDALPRGPYKRRTEVPTAAELRDFLGRLNAASAPVGVSLAGGGVKEKPSNRKPLIILHGLPPAFLKILLDPPLGIDPAFVAAHAGRRRYRPPRRAPASVGFAQWDYPELVTGFKRAIRKGRGPSCVPLPVDHLGRSTVRAVSDKEDLAAVFCRASLWAGEGADVLFLDRSVWAEPGAVLRKARTGAVALVQGHSGEMTDEKEQAWWNMHLTKREEIRSLEDELLNTLSAATYVDGNDGLMDILEDAAHDDWLDFFESLTPRQDPVVYDGTSLECCISQALEANLDMARGLARRRGRDKPEGGPSLAHGADWADLTRRLRIHMALGPTIPIASLLADTTQRKPLPEFPLGEQSIGRLPVPPRRRQSPQYPPPITDDPPSSSEENQRALDRVTYLGGILLPISIVSSILSMNEDFEPGQRLFWVFWAAAVPLTLLTMVVIYADKLRSAEVWEEVTSNWSGSSEGESESVGVGQGKRKERKYYHGDEELTGERRERRRRQRMGVSSASYPSVPVGRASVRPQAVMYSGNDVVIDFSDALAQPQVFSVDPPPSKPADQEGGDHGTDEYMEEHGSQGQSEDEDDEDESGPQDPTLVFSRPQDSTRWRKKQLGWGGAAMCILKMHKPLRVEDGVPVVPARGGSRDEQAVRRRLARTRTGSL